MGSNRFSITRPIAIWHKHTKLKIVEQKLGEGRPIEAVVEVLLDPVDALLVVDRDSGVQPREHERPVAG